MESIPDYLNNSLAITAPVLTGVLGRPDEYLTIKALEELVPQLKDWAADDDFWEAVTENFSGEAFPGEDQELGRVIEEEHQILLDALHGNQALATTIVLNVPLHLIQSRPDEARQVVINVSIAVTQVVQSPPGPARKWKALRLVRKVFVIGMGGLLIAADLVSPDPTMITKAASVGGGVAMIVTAPD